MGLFGDTANGACELQAVQTGKETQKLGGANPPEAVLDNAPLREKA